MTTKTIPCRLYVIPSAWSDVAAVFRRGPSDWWHILKWDLRSLTIEHGAWLRGRLYPRRSSLSADGRHLCYFALKGEWGTYFAVSKLPWLTALAAWKTGGTWVSGCQFYGLDDLTLSGAVLGEAPFHGHYPGRVTLTGLPRRAGGAFDWDIHNFQNELERGWSRLSPAKGLYLLRQYRKQYLPPWTTGNLPRILLRKPQATGDNSLMLVYSEQDFRYPSIEGVVVGYFLRDASGRVRPVAAAWADWDRQGRLLRATRDGHLKVDDVDQGQLRPLWSADLNDLQPTPVPPPEWATRW